MSRIVGGEHLLGDKEKVHFIEYMWHLSTFFSVQVMNYTVMSNHYHQLVRMQGRVDLSNGEILDRLHRYYGPKHRETRAFERALKRKDEQRVAELRDKYQQRMGSVSDYQKTLKQGFSSWYNELHDRHGALWMERFNSVLLQDIYELLETISFYIDLNPVRARLVPDPAAYQYCAYASSLTGEPRSRDGMILLAKTEDWEEAAALYRIKLIMHGSKEDRKKPGFVPREILQKTLEQEGHLPKEELLQLRVRHFSEGGVLGYPEFVEKHFLRNRKHFGKRRTTGSIPIEELPDSGFASLRKLKKPTCT